jgi:hypothetical protein
MTLTLFNQTEGILHSVLGTGDNGLILLALAILLFFTVAFMIAGIDFRIVLLLDTILIIGFSRMAWIPKYIEGIFWILVVGIGLYIAWINLSER